MFCRFISAKANDRRRNITSRNYSMTDSDFPHDSPSIHKLNEAREKIIQQLSQVIVGQNQVIEELLISLFARSHCLLEGVPGLAKTLMISTLARALNLSF